MQLGQPRSSGFGEVAAGVGRTLAIRLAIRIGVAVLAAIIAVIIAIVKIAAS
jgi:hypothetical protein